MSQPVAPTRGASDSVWVGKLKKHGNAVAITIPKAMCRHLHIRAGSLLVLRNRRNHHITVTPLDLTQQPLGPED